MVGRITFVALCPAFPLTLECENSIGERGGIYVYRKACKHMARFVTKNLRRYCFTKMNIDVS